MLKNKFGYSGLSQLLDEVLHGGSEFISGEENAFNALTTAVAGAKKSLFTSRFANQSIVTDSKVFHEEFISTLYATSSKVDVCERIICNNSPYKWRDVFYALVNSDTKMRVYVRAAAFSTHFELVIIDDQVGFIHFYDRSMEEMGDSRDTPLPNRRFTKSGDFVEEQVINSTFRLKGEVCQKLKSVFMRFHHKDPHKISHTILGVNNSNDASEKAMENGIGVFQLQGTYGTSEFDKNKKRRDAFDMLVKTYENCYKNAGGLNPSPSFNIEDAWNMYYGLIILSGELGRNIDIDEPKIACPEKVTLLYDSSK